MTRRFILDYVAPIPVGHRVEIEVLATVEQGLFKETKERHPHHPWVKDLDTGIEYTSCWHHEEIRGIRFKAGNDYPEERQPYVQVAERITGRVTACRLVTERIGDSWQVQTRLILE